jgi:hypothetical protein
MLPISQTNRSKAARSPMEGGSAILQHVGSRVQEMPAATGRYLSVCSIHGKGSPEALAVTREIEREIEREIVDDWEALDHAPWPYIRTPGAGAANDRCSPTRHAKAVAASDIFPATRSSY